MKKIVLLIGIIIVTEFVVKQTYAYPVPLTKEECQNMEGTAWDQAQDKCVWNPLVREGCEKLAGKIWDEAESKCKDK